MKLHLINKKLYITTSKAIKEDDLYLDDLVHPNLIKYPLVMCNFCDEAKTIIQSQSGTTSPVKTSRRILFYIG
jgi:hypothetical protein